MWFIKNLASYTKGGKSRFQNLAVSRKVIARVSEIEADHYLTLLKILRARFPVLELRQMDRSTILRIVNKSPAAIKAQSQDDWVEIFDSNAFVNDPVGTPKHKGHTNLREFHSCFIANNEITFKIKHDLIDEQACKLIRIADIHISFFRTRYGMVQPAHISYEIDPVSMKVKSLKAAWQISQARPYSDTWFMLFASCALMAFTFLPLTIRYGPIFAVKYCWGIVVGYLSGGQSVLTQLMKEAEQGNEEEFTSMFYRPESCCVRVGSSFLRPETLWGKIWNDTKKISLLDTIKCSGWRTTAFYRRMTKSGKVKIGYVEIDVMWRGPFHSAIETAYVFEEDEEATSSG